MLLSSNRALMHNDLFPFFTTIGIVLNGTSSLLSEREVTNVPAPGSPSVQFLGEMVLLLPDVSVWGSSGSCVLQRSLSVQHDVANDDRWKDTPQLDNAWLSCMSHFYGSLTNSRHKLVTPVPYPTFGPMVRL